jgi:hypothetical protein
MKCDDCLNLLTEYIDGEVIEHDATQVSAHLIACANCANEFEALTAEKEIYARYDRELNISPSMWNAIEARTTAERGPAQESSWRISLASLFAIPRFGFAFSGAMAIVIVAVVAGVMYLRTQQQRQVLPVIAGGGNSTDVKPQDKNPGAVTPPKINEGTSLVAVNPAAQGVVKASSVTTPRRARKAAVDDPGVLYKDVAYSDLAERDTAEHIQQAENLLRSIRSLQASDDDSEIDVSYEKAMSQRLLSENVVLRRDAERAGKFPTKELLGDLEPFLIDIANLPDKTTPDKLRAIKDRAQKTEIVAALVSY